MALIVYQGNEDIPKDEETINTGASPVLVGKKFVGLANQGATCYLNGLLQTLFMTPEFRKAIFSWNYSRDKDGAEEFCIPLQLQKLFGQLQLSNSRFVDTKALTKSFGWEGSEVFQQQDVQELTRVLFDALEEAFKGTPAETVIDDLYAGELIDYIRCIDVDYQSERVDKFLDFSLAIVPFGETKAMKNLAECIEMFLRPEILDGDNKYYCEKYDQKVDAIKGLKFGRLPQIMSVQLKRFVYDFSGDYVVQKKLNDQVKFPMVLDMNKYIAKKRHLTEDGTTEEILNEDFEAFLQEQMNKLKNSSSNEKKGKMDEHASATLDDILDDIDLKDRTLDPEVPGLSSIGEGSSTTVTTSDEATENISVFYGSMSDEEVQKMIQDHGEWVYELYAVLIHSGSVTGGHYYAYIKDLEGKKWYNFNDSSVLAINEKEVEEAWGGKSLYTGSSAYYSSYGTSRTMSTSSANAYMLMYRKVGISSPQVPDDMIPQYIRDLVAIEEEKRLIRQKEEEELRNRLRIRVHLDNKETMVLVKRTFTVKEALETIWKDLDLGSYLAMKEEGKKDDEASVPAVDMDVSLIRLREYNHITKLRSVAFDVEKAAEKQLSELYFNEYKHYIIETRKPDEEWEEYFQDGISILMEEFDPKALKFKEPITVRLPKGATLGDFKRKIAGMIQFPIENALISKIIPLAYNDGRQDILSTDALRLREDYTVYEGSKLVVEDATIDADVKPSLAFRTFLNAKNNIKIHYNVPPSTEFSQSMMIDGRWKIKEFRQRIADLVGLPVEECRMFKLNHKGNEFKDSDVSLTNAGVYAHMNLFVKRGKPTPPYFYPICLYKYTARDYIPGASELPAEDPLDVNEGVANGQIELVDLPEGTRVDPLSVEKESVIHHPSHTTNTYKAAAGINPYQAKIPSDYLANGTTADATVLVSSNHTDIEQIIDKDPYQVDDNDPDFQMALALVAMEYDEDNKAFDVNKENDNDVNDDVDSNQCNVDGEIEGDLAMEDFEDSPNNAVHGETLTEDEALLRDAEIVTATYPCTTEKESGSDVNEAVQIATARPMLEVERSFSRESSATNSDKASASHSDRSKHAPATPTRSNDHQETPNDPAFSTPKTSKSQGKAYEAEDVEAMEAAHKRVLHLTELQDRVQQKTIHKQHSEDQAGTTKKLQPLDLAVVDNYVSRNPTNPYIDVITTPNHYNRYRSGEAHDAMDDDLEATIAAIDAAVERTNRQAAAAVKTEGDEEEESLSETIVEPSTPAAIAEEISDFGERMVKNGIVPEQFQELDFDSNSLYVGPHSAVADFRKQIYGELLRMGMIDASVSLHRIRLREKIGNYPAKILRDGKTMQESSVYLNDHKAFCIELLAEEEHLPEDDYGDVVVQVQKWHRSSWTLSEKIDVLLPGSKPVRDIARGLGKLFQIPCEEVRILVIPRDSSLMFSDLTLATPSYSRSWFDPRNEQRLLRYMSYDMRLVEGDLLLLQDASEPLMALSAADKRSIMLVQQAQDNPSVIYADGSTSYGAGSPGTKVPSWVNSGSGASPSGHVYKYPAIRTSTSSGGMTSSMSNGIRIKTQKDRQREASEVNLNNAAGSVPSDGRTSPVDYLTGEDNVDSQQVISSSVAVGTADDDFFLGGVDDGSLMRGRYCEDNEFMRQGGPALFSDLD